MPYKKEVITKETTKHWKALCNTSYLVFGFTFGCKKVQLTGVFYR